MRVIISQGQLDTQLAEEYLVEAVVEIDEVIAQKAREIRKLRTARAAIVESNRIRNGLPPREPTPIRQQIGA